jgi:hypothetical protein
MWDTDFWGTPNQTRIKKAWAVAKITLDPARRNGARVESDNRTGQDGLGIVLHGDEPQNIWKGKNVNKYEIQPEEEFGYSTKPGDHIYYGSAEELKGSEDFIEGIGDSLQSTYDPAQSGGTERENNQIISEFIQIMRLNYLPNTQFPNIAAFNLTEQNGTPVPLKEISIADDQNLGIIAQVGVGELLLWKENAEQKAQIYSPPHHVCSSLDIKGRQGNKIVLGHAHLIPTRIPMPVLHSDGSYRLENLDNPDKRNVAGTSYAQFQAVLSYLTSSGLQDIELIFNKEKEAYGMPAASQIISEAKKRGMHITIVERENFTSVSSFTSQEEIIYRRMRFASDPENVSAQKWRSSRDKAMRIDREKIKGGIDLTHADKVLQTQNSGIAIKFHMDQAMLKQLQNAPGFVPVIISVRPVTNLRRFLEIP